MGSDPAIAATYGFGQVLHLQLPVTLRLVNSDAVSISADRSASERLMLCEDL